CKNNLFGIKLGPNEFGLNMYHALIYTAANARFANLADPIQASSSAANVLQSGSFPGSDMRFSDWVQQDPQWKGATAGTYRVNNLIVLAPDFAMNQSWWRPGMNNTVYQTLVHETLHLMILDGHVDVAR